MIIVNSKFKEDEINEKQIEKFKEDFKKIILNASVKMFVKIEYVENNETKQDYLMVARDYYGDKFSLISVDSQKVLINTCDGINIFADLVVDFIDELVTIKTVKKIKNIYSGDFKLEVEGEKEIIVGKF